MNRILKEEITRHKIISKNIWKIAITILKTGELFIFNFTLDNIFDPNNIERIKVFNVDINDNIIYDQSSGKCMIYAPKINDKTFLHFSWRNDSACLRDYSLSSNIDPKEDRLKRSSEIRKLIKNEIEIANNEPNINDISYWHKRTKEINKTIRNN